jgi:hypothetical protein
VRYAKHTGCTTTQLNAGQPGEAPVMHERRRNGWLSRASMMRGMMLFLRTGRIWTRQWPPRVACLHVMSFQTSGAHDPIALGAHRRRPVAIRRRPFCCVGSCTTLQPIRLLSQTLSEEGRCCEGKAWKIDSTSRPLAPIARPVLDSGTLLRTPACPSTSFKNCFAMTADSTHRRRN